MAQDKAAFQWDDPLLLEQQLSQEERMVRDSARAYCQGKLAPRVLEAFRHENQLAVPFAFADATVLKTIVRSNPGLSLWKDGVVLGNWHHNDTPASSDVLGLIGQP